MIERREISKTKLKKIKEILRIDSIQKMEQFVDPELDKIYDTYFLTVPSKEYVLKKTEESEVASYQLLSNASLSFPIPQLINTYKYENEEWILIEHIEGNDLQVLDAKSAENLGKALAKISSYFYHTETLENIEKSLRSPKRLLARLPQDSNLYKAYQLYVERRKRFPRTFTHDDLLPINVLSKDGKINIIDWGYGKKGTYVTDVARFYSFYSNKKESYENGFSFLAEETYTSLFLDSYFEGLAGELKNQIAKEQFLSDVQMEALNQYLLNLNHLDTITPSSLSSEWDKFFYDKATDQAELLLKGLDY